MGPSQNGIDFVIVGEEQAQPSCFIKKPKERYLTILGDARIPLPVTLVIGNVDVEAKVNGVDGPIEKVDFYLDGQLVYTDEVEPYNWTWSKPSFFRHVVKTVAYYDDKSLYDQLIVWKFL